MKVELDGNIATYWDVVLQEFDWVFDENHQWAKQRKWCGEFEGKGRFYVDPIFGQFYFECEEDRMMFLLRWSRD